MGDGVEEAIRDKMGVEGGGGGEGVGVEAAAVVVITLLAVLGNAMVVATLVRRSLLHHPSNRLVLSLTGSNLILTVVVLPGMVTSLLMTPASPSNRHSTLSHQFNDTGVLSSSSSSSQRINETVALLGLRGGSFIPSQHSNASFLPSQYQNSSSIMFQNPKGASSVSQHDIDSSISSSSYDGDAFAFSHFQNSPAVTSSSPTTSYSTTNSPLYLEVSSVIDNPPVPQYNHRRISLLSQELESVEGPAPPPLPWHHSTDSSQNLEHALALLPPHQQNPNEEDELERSFRKEVFPENTKSQRSNSPYAKHHQVPSTTKVLIPDLEGNEEEEDQDKKTGGKEIISRSIHNDKGKAFDNQKDTKDHLQEEREMESIISPPHSTSKSKLEKRSRVTHRNTHQENSRMVPVGDDKVKEEEDEKVEEEMPQLEGKIVFDSQRPTDHMEEREGHSPNRRRKQGTRHYQHRKQRLRRNRGISVDNENVQLRPNVKSRVNNQRQRRAGEMELSGLKESTKKDDFRRVFNEYNTREEDQDQISEVKKEGEESSGQGYIKQEVQVRIRQQQSEKHVILVRGVQEIEEEEENQMMVVVVDQDEQREQHHEIQLMLQQHLETVHQKGPAPTSSSTADEQLIDGRKQEDLLGDHRPKLTIMDLQSPQDLQEHKDQQKPNHTSSPDERIDSQMLHLQDRHSLGIFAQEQVMDDDQMLEKQHQELEDPEESKQVEGVEQIYGVEWESDRWEGGRILCQGAAFFTNLITAASSLTVAVIAIDRYLAIVRPLVYGVMVTSGRCLMMLAWCWGQALLTALPPLLGWARYERREPYGRCGVAWGDSPSYTAVWTISVFLIPCSVMVVCYYHILQVARNKCRRIRVGKVSETSPPNTPDTTAACLDGFPFPLSVAHLVSPPIGAKTASPVSSSPTHGKVSPMENLSGHPLGSRSNLPPLNAANFQGNGQGPPLVKSMTTNGGLESYIHKPVPCRSYSVGGMVRATDSTTNANDSSIKPKRKLADFGRSRSLCQVPQQPPRPCLRRVQSTFSVRHTLKKLSLGTRRPSWNWEGSPSKGFWTVFVVMGAHVLTWGPYTFMAIAEAILGREHLLLLPHWVTVTCTLLLFTASVFYPIVYGLYNRNIRKELLTCLCPTWARRRGSHLRRPSTLPSYSGSVLDFTSIRQRSATDKADHCINPSNGITGTIATISSTVASLACPAPLMIMGDEGAIPTRGYNLNLRKPSQDSGTVMVGGDDQDSDVEAPAPPRHHTTRRVSAPSVLSTVREDPHTAAFCTEDPHPVGRHHSMNSRNLPVPQKKNPQFPLSVQLLNASPVVLRSSLRRSRSFDKIHSDDKDMTLDNKITYRSLRKKHSVSVIRETHFNTPPTSERVTRRRGSLAVVKVMAIPEDCGLPEYPEVTDSGRGSVDSGRASKTRTLNGRGSVDSADFTKTFSLRCRGSVDSADLARVQAFSRRGSVDSTEIAMARAVSKQDNGDNNIDLAKSPATRHVSIDEGIGGDCLPEEEASWE